MNRKKQPESSRRDFLITAGQAAATIPFFTLLKYSSAEAATAVAPLRFISIMSPYQTSEPFFHPQNSSGGLATSGTSFNLNFNNSVLAPLAPYQSKLIVFRGLKYTQGINSHLSAATAFSGLTLNNVGDGLRPNIKGSTLDQYLFKRMAKAGSLDPMTIGLYSYGYSDHNVDGAISWRDGIARPQVCDPFAIYKTYFSGFTPPSGSAPVTDPLALRRAKALQLTQASLSQYLSRLPASNRSAQALSSHKSAVDGFLSSLNINPSGGGSLASCSPPASSSITVDGGAEAGNFDYSKFNPDINSFVTLISQAFACDLTRFASINFSTSTGISDGLTKAMPGLETFTGNIHGDLSHSMTGVASNSADLKMSYYKKYWMSQVALLMAKLQATADPFNASQTLLDNTVILIGSEGPVQTNGSDQHGNTDPNSDQMYVLAGGCGGMFKMGQLIDSRGVSGNVISHNALLTNIVNAFETNQKSFNPSFSPNILTRYGDYNFTVSPTSWLS